MKIGSLDLDTRFEYLIVYERDGEINTWTLGKSGLKINYPKMKKDKNVKLLGIYKKLSDTELLNIMID